MRAFAPGDAVAAAALRGSSTEREQPASAATGPMPAPRRTVQARLLLGFPELVAECGGNAQAMLADLGLPTHLTSAGDTVPTYRQMLDILNHAAASLSCPDFGLRLASRRDPLSIFGPLGTVMRNSRTFGEAIGFALANSHAHSATVRVWMTALLPEDGVLIGHEILLDDAADRRQGIELIMLCGHLAAMALTGGKTRARQVHYRHAPLLPGRFYRRYFGCEVLFGQHADGLLFSCGDLLNDVVGYNDAVRHAVVREVESRFESDRPTLADQVQGYLMQHIGSDRCSNEQIAAALNIHKRVLHRRLAQAGTSFIKLKDKVRRDLMLQYLRHTQLTLTRVSELLGFAEQAVMTRKCQLWFGATPSELRRGGAPGRSPAP